MSTTDRIRDFILGDLGWPGRRSTLTDDRPLIEDKVLDSLGIFELVTFLEEDFQIEVRDEELVAANFQSIAALAAFIESKQKD